MQSATIRTTKSDIQGLNYTQIPGAASFAAASPDGSLWALSTQPSGPDKYIWHYSGGNWTNISGLASRLSVAPNGTLYALNSGGGVYAYTSGTGIWSAVGGGCRDLSVASDGSLYIISSGSGADGAIWHFAGGSWTQLMGSGSRIAASWDPNTYASPAGSITPGGFYVANSQGSLYYFSTSGYVQIPGAASSVAPITGGLFALGYPSDPNGNVLYYYDLANPGWSAKGGSGASLSSDGKTLYIVGASGNIYSSPITPVGQGVTGTGTAHFTLSDPYSTATSSSSRRPAYFSRSTSYVTIAINGGTPTQMPLGPTSPTCALLLSGAGETVNCTADLPAPNGPIAFTVITYDAGNHSLSQVTGNATINGYTTVPLSLQGVWQNANVRLAKNSLPMGAPSQTQVKVTAYDADGALIVGPEPYSSPIPLIDSDTSGATQLSTAAVTAPGQSVTFSYDGVSYVDANIGTGSSFGGDTFTPILRATEYFVPTTASSNGFGNKGIYANSDGTLTFLDVGNQAIGRVTTNGQITETNLPHFPSALAKGADGKPWVLASNCLGCTPLSELERLNDDGTLTEYPFTDYITGPMALGSDGNFWIAVNQSGAIGVRRVTPAGVIKNFLIGSEDDLAYEALGPDGNIWFAARYQSTWNFVKVDTSGQATNYASPPTYLTQQPISNIAWGSDQQLYAIFGGQELTRVSTSGVLSQVAAMNGDTGGGQAIGLGPDGAIWFSVWTSAATCPEIGRATVSGQIAYFFLPICQQLGGSSTAGAQPSAFTIGPDGNLWYTRGSYIGKITI